MQPANLPLQIYKGATFRARFRVSQPTPEYRDITAIIPSSPVRLTVDHGLPTDWQVWIDRVRQLPDLNRALNRQQPHIARLVDAQTLEISTINAAGTNAAGGQIVYYPPLPLTGATAVLTLYEKGAAAGTLAVTVDAAGWVDLLLTDEQTALLDWNEQQYTLDIELSSGDVIRAYHGNATVQAAGMSVPSTCQGFAVIGGDRGPPGPTVSSATFDTLGRLVITLEDGTEHITGPLGFEFQALAGDPALNTALAALLGQKTDLNDFLAFVQQTVADLAGKVDKVAGKELSTNDYTTAEKVKQSLVGSVDYGKITLPADFQHNLDFNLWRGQDGMIRHDFRLELKTAGYAQYYVSEFGSDSNDGLTAGTPKQNIRFLIPLIESDANVSGATINIVSDYLTRNVYTILGSTVMTKNYHIRAANTSGRVRVGCIERGLIWSLHSSGVYRTTRTATRNVFDARFDSLYGLPLQLIHAVSLAACEATKGSWFTDGSLVYVHLLDGSAPDNNFVYVCLQVTAYNQTINTNALTVLQGIHHLEAGSSHAMLFNNTGSVTRGHVILVDVEVAGSLFGGNAVYANGLKSIWSFNSLSSRSGADGFNYHSVIDGDTFALEYDCYSNECGVSGDSADNCTSAHDGMRILRIGSKGGNSYGPVLADVNGCYSICYDCQMGESLRAPGPTKASFYFDDAPSPHDPTPNGKAILINCSGGSATTLGISCDESFKAQGKIVVKNFRGANIPVDIDFEVL